MKTGDLIVIKNVKRGWIEEKEYGRDIIIYVGKNKFLYYGNNGLELIEIGFKELNNEKVKILRPKIDKRKRMHLIGYLKDVIQEGIDKKYSKSERIISKIKSFIFNNTVKSNLERQFDVMYSILDEVISDLDDKFKIIKEYEEEL